MDWQMATLIPRSVAGRFAFAGSGSPGANDLIPTGKVETRRCFSRCPFSVAASMSGPPEREGEILPRALARPQPPPRPSPTSDPAPGTLRALPEDPMPANDHATLV